MPDELAGNFFVIFGLRHILQPEFLVFLIIGGFPIFPVVNGCTPSEYK
jgi:hypothetical protein